MATLRTVLSEGAARLAHLPTGRRDTELLLLRAVGRDRAWLLTHPDEEISQEHIDCYQAWIRRRAAQEPVQYILGEQEFYGLRFRVTPDVLIPRPETEHLVEALLARVSRDAALRVADVGTGSGAIAVALAHVLPRAQVTALDISQAALAVAQGNAQAHGVEERMRFLPSDLLGAVQGERFDAVVSNPPYIASGELLETQVRDYEPHTALFAGATGLDIYERLIPQAREALAAGGWLMLEMGHGQREALTGLLAGWSDVEFVDDLQGIPRVAIARRGA
ncbi:peptide chain release factor N(5)-glutamine methyltransferase [Paracidobacterium acidisoli]|uniref:Release factor glutamine methyltransferase n=1 Tax=Paracidobacterium acidisoli TaxID=2303751 RepID=A0A372IPP0_9BACT|nr:peptide chain release factor N(5)-glutamine methyltransferase [Paracidobacterium acidisoli]MBT9331147.1 peptide chain release factor N(5)-glutamine methyltransferase [Paracidobacterium acidisoli]